MIDTSTLQAMARALVQLRPGVPWTMDHDTGTITWHQEGVTPPTQAEIGAAVSGLWRTDAWNAYRARREGYITRLQGRASRAAREGDAALCTACDTLTQALLDLPDDATLAAAADQAALEQAIADRITALTADAAAGDAAVQAEIDKAFR